MIKNDFLQNTIEKYLKTVYFIHKYRKIFLQFMPVNN